MSWYELADAKKSAWWKDLNFWVKPKSAEYLEFPLPFDLLFRDVKEIKTSLIPLFAKNICKKVRRAI